MVGLLPAPCARCGTTIEVSDRWVIGHIKDRVTHPELTWEPSNWRHEHRRCSDASAQSAVQAKAAADALRAAGVVSSSSPPHGQTPSLPLSLPDAAGSALNGAVVVPDAMKWDRTALAGTAWLEGLLDPPADAAVPLAMTPPHPSAVGSYGPQAVEWIEANLRIELRWWQRLAVVRQLEHDAAGELVWRTVVESCPRRAGKSVRIRGMALWRMAHRDLIGEVQTVVHCGNDLPICREIQRGAWRWADSQGWTIIKSNGKEAVEAPDGSRWLVRSQDGVYGWDAGLAVVDEAWDVKPDTVSEGLEPAMLERRWPQLHLTSTAHRRATSLMRSRITDALSGSDPHVLLLLWAAAPDADPGDPQTWRAASPHWSHARGEMIGRRYAAALAGEVDPEADDLDPVAGWASQYLNVWSLRPAPAQPGDPVVDPDQWAGLEAALPSGVPDAVAVEGWPGQGLAVARAWHVDGRAVVAVQDVPGIPEAAALVAGYRCRRRPVVGASLATDPTWAGRATPAKTAVRTAVADLTGLLRDDALRHDGGDCLTGQILGLRTTPAADGHRVRSTGRADAVKAVVWAAQAARSPKPRAVVLVPTGT